MTLRLLLIQVWVLAFVAILGSELLIAEPVLRIASQVLFALPLVAWGALRLRGPRSPLDGAILGGIGVLLLVSVLSRDQQGSLETVGLAIAYALAFFAARDAAGHPRLMRAIAVAAAYAIVGWLTMTAAYWIAEKASWIGAIGTVPPLESNQVFIWGTANVFPVLSLLAVPLLVLLPAGLGRRAVVALWAVSSAVVLPLSQGRAAWLGIGVAALAYEALGGWPLARTAVRWLRAHRLILPATSLLGLLVVVVALAGISRGPELVSANLGDRLRIWQQALEIFASDPLSGGGPSTYAWLRLVHVPAYTYPVGVRLAHDVPLQTAADGGVLLLVALGGVVTTFVAEIVRRGRANLERSRRAAAAVVVGFGAASLLDDFSSLPAVIALVVILAAIAVTPAGGQSPPPRGPVRLLAPATLALIGLVALPAITGAGLAQLAAGEGRAAAVSGDWPRAADRFAAAVDAYPGQAGYRLGHALALARTGASEAARAEYTAARDLSPGDPRPWGALAALTGDAEVRQQLLEEAARRGVSDPQYAFRLGEVLHESGLREDAVEAFATAVALEPDLIAAFPARENGRPGRDAVIGAVDAVLSRIAESAAISGQLVTWDLALAAGRLPDDAPAGWLAVRDAASGDLAGARAEVRRVLAAAPNAAATLRVMAAVARYACDRAGYEAVRSQLGPHRPRRTVEVGVVRDYAYGGVGLGTYQPMTESSLPIDLEWPWGLVGNPPACPGWTPP